MTRVWRANVDGKNHTLELTETRIRLSADEGTPESYSGRDLTYPRFLRGDKWQRYVDVMFGAEALQALREEAEKRARS
jgi:hypothetical protein